MHATGGLGQVLTILIVAFALGMDAFSLGVGIGMKGIRKFDILKISAVVALFHIFMPLAGIYMGKYIGSLMGHMAVLIGGGLLILLGAHMIYCSLKGSNVQTMNYGSVGGLLLLAFMVSIDSFSVGVSLGVFAADVVITVLLFGFFGGFMSVQGLLVGRGFSRWAGDYGEAIGGAILLAFGIKFLL